MRALRIFGRIAVRLGLLALLCWGGWWLVADPRSPLPTQWRPLDPLHLGAPATGLIRLKVARALSTPERCRAALATGAGFDVLPALEAGPQCGIANRVEVASVGEARLDPVETACATALRLALWERHAVQPAARDILGQPVARLRHQGSYNCRAIRGGTRPSAHATGRAIDIRGVVLADGTRLELLGNWDAQTQEGRFWRALHRSACRWFVTVLGPDFDANHADHLHLQSIGWGTCR